jgi:hypothetical protein
MCYSAEIREIQRDYLDAGVRIDYIEAERIFLKRQRDRLLKIPRVFEAYFDQPSLDSTSCNDGLHVVQQLYINTATASRHGPRHALPTPCRSHRFSYC